MLLVHGRRPDRRTSPPTQTKPGAGSEAGGRDGNGCTLLAHPATRINDVNHKLFTALEVLTVHNRVVFDDPRRWIGERDYKPFQQKIGSLEQPGLKDNYIMVMWCVSYMLAAGSGALSAERARYESEKPHGFTVVVTLLAIGLFLVWLLKKRS